MFSRTLKRSSTTLAVMAGLLAVAGPASAQGGGADFTRLYGPPSLAVDGYQKSTETLSSLTAAPTPTPASATRMASADYCGTGSPRYTAPLGTFVNDLLDATGPNATADACAGDNRVSQTLNGIHDGTSNTLETA